jgi:hypothetical protein
MNKSDELYFGAYRCMGVDITPKDYVADTVGCAEAVNAIYKSIFGKPIGGGASTAEMYRALCKHPDFEQVFCDIPERGWIVISPTGYGNGNLRGHVGITGKTHIMSNDSNTGKWDAKFTIETWRNYYTKLGGIPTYFFKPINS